MPMTLEALQEFVSFLNKDGGLLLQNSTYRGRHVDITVSTRCRAANADLGAIEEGATAELRVEPPTLSCSEEILLFDVPSNLRISLVSSDGLDVIVSCDESAGAVWEFAPIRENIYYRFHAEEI